MLNFVLVLQYIAIAILFIEFVYAFFQRPSKNQTTFLILAFSSAVMLAGYSIELAATDQTIALLGVSFSYIGKPFALLMLLYFITDYTGYSIKKPINVILLIYNIIFPVIVFTNPWHHLYYSTVEFDITRRFSPLILGHGPLYYLYMVTIIFTFVWALVVSILEIINCKTRDEKIRGSFILGIVGSSIVGYLVFIFGWTGGYDATMLGAFVGTIIVFILFFRYRLFDTLTVSMQRVIEDSANAVALFDASNRIVYKNAMMELLITNGVSADDLRSIEYGETVFTCGDLVYSATKNRVEHKHNFYGTTLELFDITAQYRYSERLEKDVEKRTSEILRIQRSITTSFAGIVEARDSTTGTHINRMSNYVRLIAEALRNNGKYTDVLTDEYITCLVDVAPLHDIGKLSISDTILNKPGRLTPDEFEIIKTHSKLGAEIIETCLGGVEREEYVDMAKSVALYHHEKWDGSGYPEKLKGEEIPLSARIVALADVYDAISSVRCYKPAMSKEEAKQVILDGKGKHFDPYIAEAFEDVIEGIEYLRDNNNPD